MILSQLLQPQNNNLDIFRVIAALLVIYGHASTFLPGEAGSDFVFDWLGFDYSGSLAVKFFFMLSGLLVTHSLLVRPQIFPFLLRRAVRIFPGLFVCIFLSVFVLGLIVTSLSVEEYLLHPQTWRYWLHNSSLIGLQWELPGVFTNAQTSTVNGSLWTLPLEVMCYASLIFFYLLVLRWHHNFAGLMLLAIIILIFYCVSLWPSELIKFKEPLLLGGCFCIGALAALLRYRLVLGIKGIVLCLGAVFLMWQTPLQQLAFYCVFFYVCLYLSGTALFTKTLRFPGDPSYGIYIYGFIIQQCLVMVYPAQGILFNQIAAAIIAIIVGYFSWYLIEKPAIRMMKKRIR